MPDPDEAYFISWKLAATLSRSRYNGTRGILCDILPRSPFIVLLEHPILFAVVKCLIIVVLSQPLPCCGHSAKPGVKFSQGVI
jgi:hypothetical protein